MKTIYKAIATVAVSASLFTSCIKETVPQASYVTSEQAANAPDSFDGFVAGITTPLLGSYFAFNDSGNAFDFGYPSFFLMRDVMGQDITVEAASGYDHFTSWYECSVALGPSYLICQYPWRCYYKWIKNCNNVIGLAAGSSDPKFNVGLGIAHTVRAMLYLDLAQMYAPETYVKNPEAETVPLVTESTNEVNNPRLTNAEMFKFILSDLDKAEQELADYKRSDILTPDASVVYGMKARAYLIMGEWSKAAEYAVKAQEGYTKMSETEWTNHEDAFSAPTAAWMFALKENASDQCVVDNDGDTSWGAQMILDLVQSGCGYAASYGAPKRIDAHLYSTIPATDWRKNCFVDFALDNESDPIALVNALAKYAAYPEGLIETASASGSGMLGGLCTKFRAAGGDAGRKNMTIGLLTYVPLMRVEEMILIEAEAKGMLNEAEGKAILTDFAKSRNPEWTYSSEPLREQIWWQRRVEFWGEGLATFDIKRLQKGIVRSYAGTNHPEGYRWNTTGVPDWMTLCIVESECDNNKACTNNPVPVKPTEDSPEYVW